MGRRWRSRLNKLEYPQAGASILEPTDWDGSSCWEAVFRRRAPLAVEIGCGKGEFLVEMAQRHSSWNLVGFEIDPGRLRWIDYKVHRADLTNVRLVGGDAVQAMPRLFRDAQVETVWMNFPDPWPKKRHEKRRLIRQDVIDEVVRILQPGGVMTVVTDVEWYAHVGLELMEERVRVGLLEAVGRAHSWLERPADYPETIHEWKFRRDGRRIHYLNYRRC